MFVIIGTMVVLASVAGGFLMSHGNLLALVQENAVQAQAQLFNFVDETKLLTDSGEIVHKPQRRKGAKS